MLIRSTEQQQALDEMHVVPPRLVDPRSNEAYGLLPLAECEAVREIVRNLAVKGRQELQEAELKEVLQGGGAGGLGMDDPAWVPTVFTKNRRPAASGRHLAAEAPISAAC